MISIRLEQAEEKIQISEIKEKKSDVAKVDHNSSEKSYREDNHFPHQHYSDCDCFKKVSNEI